MGCNSSQCCNWFFCSPGRTARKVWSRARLRKERLGLTEATMELPGGAKIRFLLLQLFFLNPKPLGDHLMTNKWPADHFETTWKPLCDQGLNTWSPLRVISDEHLISSCHWEFTFFRIFRNYNFLQVPQLRQWYKCSVMQAIQVLTITSKPPSKSECLSLDFHILRVQVKFVFGFSSSQIERCERFKSVMWD